MTSLVMTPLIHTETQLLWRTPWLEHEIDR
jgi:hypothetical protein